MNNNILMQVGACTYHAHECGAGACIFIRVRECEILLLASPNRGCFMTPPYLDDYGETGNLILLQCVLSNKLNLELALITLQSIKGSI